MAGRPRRSGSQKAKWSRTHYMKARRNGLCVWCSRKAAGGILCRICRSKSRFEQRKLAQARKAAGACRECGLAAQGRLMCPVCALKRSQRPSRQPEYRKQHEYRKAA